MKNISKMISKAYANADTFPKIDGSGNYIGDPIEKSGLQLEYAKQVLTKIGIQPTSGRELFYVECLQQVIMNITGLEQISSDGFDLTASTSIHHSVFFESIDNAAEFATLILEYGYEITNMGTDSEDLKVVEFIHKGKLDLIAITKTNMFIAVLAKHFDGAYAGWGLNQAELTSIGQTAH